MIEVHGQRERKKLPRRSVQIRLAPQDARELATICSEAGRSYGEQIALWLRERQLKQEVSQ